MGRGQSVYDHLGFPGELTPAFDEGDPLTPPLQLHIFIAVLPPNTPASSPNASHS
jgi:hypothetical protein